MVRRSRLRPETHLVSGWGPICDRLHEHRAQLRYDCTRDSHGTGTVGHLFFFPHPSAEMTDGGAHQLQQGASQRGACDDDFTATFQRCRLSLCCDLCARLFTTRPQITGRYFTPDRLWYFFEIVLVRVMEMDDRCLCSLRHDGHFAYSWKCSVPVQ